LEKLFEKTDVALTELCFPIFGINPLNLGEVFLKEVEVVGEL
jgi:hypothetical protein